MTPDELLRLAALRADVLSGRVKTIRQTCGPVSQCEIAQAIGTTPAAIGGWEAGRRMPRGRAALRYAALLDEMEKQHAKRIRSGQYGGSGALAC